MASTMTIILTGEETGAAWSLIEYTAPPHFRGPLPHVHEQAQESFVVLDGTLVFRIGGQTVEAPGGTFVLVPAGIEHTFVNPAATPATYLAWFSPPGTEQACRELATLITTEPIWPATDSYKLAALCRQHRSAMAAPQSV